MWALGQDVQPPSPFYELSASIDWSGVYTGVKLLAIELMTACGSPSVQVSSQHWTSHIHSVGSHIHKDVFLRKKQPRSPCSLTHTWLLCLLL
jgi:hypothetical protein